MKMKHRKHVAFVLALALLLQNADLSVFAASPAADGKYYVTYDGTYGNGEVNSSSLFNPKTGEYGSATPYRIELGHEEAMCVTYGANAVVNTEHNYVPSSISDLKNNPYFKGGKAYPVEDYLRGACYAYERLASLNVSGHNFKLPSGVYDADYEEMIRCINTLGYNGSTFVYYAGDGIYYSVLQIITWQIACGTFNPDSAECVATAADIFGQMFPASEGWEEYASAIIYMYNYYAACAKECASRDYNDKFKGVNVKYWAVQGNNSANWQDFITWEMPSPVPQKIDFKIDKYGIFTNSKFPNATFDIYSDSGCTHKIGEFTTDYTGSATINIVEGIYYLKETSAPAGTVLNLSVITLVVDDDTVSASVTNDEYYNGLIFQKFDSNTRQVIESPGAFALYEYVSGKNTYMKVCDLTYTAAGFTSGTATVPAHSYYMTGETACTYHNNDGTVACTLTRSTFLYTPVNQGKYKIVEETAPAGYQINITGKAFTMNTSTQGYRWEFTSPAKAMTDAPNYAGVTINKYDTLSEERLKGAAFKLQERINGTWYDVGTLGYDADSDTYRTTAEEKYLFHNASGSILFQKTGTLYPLCRTSYNNGVFRIVETVKPDENYVNTSSKQFLVNPADNETMYTFMEYGHGIGTAALNLGKAVKVTAGKYDAVTKEKLSGDAGTATLTIYEYNHYTEEWEALGNLTYNPETGEYETDSRVFYTPHREDGTASTASLGAAYRPGYIYYTSVNRGRFKVAETEAPAYYLNGVLNPVTRQTVPYEKEFQINADVPDKTEIDLTGISNAAQDTGISANVELVKYDALTKDAVFTGDAVFTVYEYMQDMDEWLAVGQMVYDTEQKIYTTKGMKAVFHNSKGESVYPEDNAYGLYYTTANAGRFKVEETKAPQDYITGSIPYSREFNITDIENGLLDLTTWENGAANLGVSGTVRVAKLDALTKEPVLADNAVFTVYEQINENWYAVGDLVYDRVTDHYTGDNAAFTFHDEAGTPIDTAGIPDFLSGRLYYTTANRGRFKVVETKAPDYYTLSGFEQTFALNDGNTEIEYLTEEKAAHDLGVSGTVKTAKYDAVTKEKVFTGDAVFTVYERINVLNEWLPVGILVYDEETQEYVCDNTVFTFHDEAGNPIDTAGIPDFLSGRLYYTTANRGRFKVEETKAPQNYTLDGYSREFTLPAADTAYDFTTAETGATDTGIAGAVQLIKADSVTEEPLSGAVFTLQEWSEPKQDWLDAGTLTDNGDGTYTVNQCYIHIGPDEKIMESEHLVYTTQNLGRFRIVETEAPDGYLNEGWESEELNLTDDRTEFIFENEHMVKNVPIRVSVSKKSITTGKEIEGAKLTITDSKGTVIDTWITDGSEHILSAIPAGTYTLTEEAAPEGYLITNSIEFEVTGTAEIQKVEMFDEEVKGRLIINKVDSVTKAALAGAVFELKDEQGNVIQTLITDENGHAESELLAFGIYDTNGRYLGSKKYTLTEITSPNGYRLDGTPITIGFEYQNDQTEVVEVTVTVSNEKEPEVPEVPTGDKADYAAFLILMLGAALAIGTSVYCKKRNRE